MGSKCASTFSAKRSGNLSSRSSSGETVSLSSLSSWSAPPPWPSAAGGSGGGDRGAVSAPYDEILPWRSQLVRAALRGDERARWSGGASLQKLLGQKMLVAF